MGFIATPKPAALVENTRKPDDIDVSRFDAIVVAGGQGPMFTFERALALTGCANVEEDFVDQAVWSMNLLSRDKHVMPWRIEDELKRLGANYARGMWRGFAVRDGNLITGQQNFSGTETAELVVRALGE